VVAQRPLRHHQGGSARAACARSIMQAPPRVLHGAGTGEA